MTIPSHDTRDDVLPSPAGPITTAPARAERKGHAGRWVLALIVVAAVGGGVVVMRKRAATSAAAPGGAPADRVVPVTVATVEVRDVPLWLEGLGNATPLFTVTVKSQVDGRLDRVLFKEGQPVKAGQVIAQIDPRPFTIALHNAQAARERDGAQARNARLNLERYTTLRGQNLIPQQQVDDQQTVADQAEAATRSDDAQVESARLQLDYAAIKSPIDGVTGVRLVDPGNLVHANDAGGIVVITQLDPMAVLFTLPEDDLPRVSKAMAGGKLPVEAFGRDGVTKLATGDLALIDNQVNATTATIKLKALFPNGARTLWPNEFVKARLLLETRKGAIVVPAATVQRGPQGTFAYVVGEGDTVSVRPIDVDATQGELALIAKGLKGGERVVTDGQNQLRAGAKITARPADKDPPPERKP